MHYFSSILFIALFFSATLRSYSQNADSSKELEQLFDTYYEDRLKLFPLDATSIGDNRYNDKLPNSASANFRRQTHELYTRYLSALDKFNRESLNYNDQVSYDIFKELMVRELEGEKFPHEYIPFAQFHSLPLTMGVLGSGVSSQPFKTETDYNNWLKRVEAFIIYTDTAIANFRAGLASGIVLPKILVERMIPQMENLAQTDTGKSVFYKPVTNMPVTINGQSRTRLKAAYAKVINTKLAPAYRRLADFLKNEYLPKARPTSGLHALPQGDEMYKYAAYYFTTTRTSPQEIYNTGLQEVERITAEMEKLKNEIGFKGSLKELFEFMKTDKQFMPFKTEEEVLAANNAVLKTIEPQLNSLFNIKPKTPFEIRPVESFRAATAAPQYHRSSADGKRPGIFYLPILDPAKINVTGWALQATFLHEAIPGHHYQISLQQENTKLPRFRRFAFLSAFSEGWALYTESLGKELGCYTDPYQEMGAFGAEIHRAIRLVVDVGLHTGKMNREEAIKYMLEHEALPEQVATAEIERYMAMPGQALSYKMGELTIKKLKSKYASALGEKFDVRSFHDAILLGGAMPLNIFESYMDSWSSSFN